ncbi:MAG TPA: ActD protein [Myxococcales bacterium]|nr:ActD protein [Myxococcales bacterium]
MMPRIPDWVLERHLVGELPQGFTEADLAADPTVPERLAALRASDAEILDRHPPAVVAARVRDRDGRRREERRALTLRWVPVAAAAGLIAVVAPVVVLLQGPGQGPTDLQTKGLEPHLEVFRRGPDGNQALTSGATGHPGDVIQLRVVPASARYGAVLAIDSAGASVLMPPREISTGGSFALPDALELDASGAFERFVLVTSDQPFQADAVLEAARAAGADPAATLRLSPPLKQSSFVILKQR